MDAQERQRFQEECIDVFVECGTRKRTKPAGSTRSISVGAEGADGEERGIHVTLAKILKWGLVVTGVFGAGYVLRGFADSTSGTASLLDALKNRKGDGEAKDGHFQPMGPPPNPEELAYWNQWYRAGAEAARTGPLPPPAIAALVEENQS
jgi:hypothetical protein